MDKNMAEYCFGEDYKKKFDADWYLKTFYGQAVGASEEGEFLSIVLSKLHKMFNSLDTTDCQHMLDFGSGPNVHTSFSASRVFKTITFAEYAENNRKAILKWINKEEGAHDWMPLMKFVGDMEGISGSEIEMRSRQAIKEVIPCDVHDPYPLGKNKLESYDLIISSLCLEAACNSKESYTQAVKKLCNMIKPKGHFILIGVLGQTYYQTGSEKFYTLTLSKDDVHETVTSAGMDILQYDCMDYKDSENPEKSKGDELSDFDGYFVMLARKT